MLEPFFNKYPAFTASEKPNPMLIEKYRAILPLEIIHVWESLGFGTAMNGYLKFVNPDEWNGFMREAYLPLGEPATVFALSAMADLFLYENESIVQVRLRYGDSKIVGMKPGTFFNGRLTDWEYSLRHLRAELFPSAILRLGTPDFDECFGYVPALALGGSEQVEKLQRLKIREHMAILSGIIGQIQVREGTFGKYSK